jgi:hypothetical protein
MRLVLDAHVLLAFAVGAISNVKLGKAIEVEQRTNGRRFWARDDARRTQSRKSCEYAPAIPVGLPPSPDSRIPLIQTNCGLL